MFYFFFHVIHIFLTHYLIKKFVIPNIIYKSIKALGMKISIVFNLIIDLYFLIPTVIPEIFNPSAELVIATRTQNNNVNQKLKHK